MHTNKRDDNGWVLCPSKSIPGKFYYFNVMNGEAVWSLPDAKKPLNMDIQHVVDKSHSFPEPEIVKNNEKQQQQPQITHKHKLHNSINMTTPNKQANTPMFGQISFPKYVFNGNPTTAQNSFDISTNCFPNKNTNMPIFGQTTQKVVWAPIPLMLLEPNESKMLDQVTQTCELEKVYVHSCEIPLSKRFVNYEKPVITFSIDNKLETNNIFTSTPLKPHPIFDSMKPNSSSNDPRHIKKPLIKDPVLDIKNLKISNNPQSFQSLKPNLFSQNKIEKNDQSILRSRGKTFANYNSEEKINVESNVNKEQDLVKLDRNDLRLLLMARKRRYTEGENNTESSEMKKIKLKYRADHAQVSSSKKRVTFAVNDPEIADENDNEYLIEGIHTIENLRDLAECNTRQDCWYIVVDTDVLLENYEFINNWIQADATCRLLIPKCIYGDIKALCSGDSFGRKHVYTARQVARVLDNPPPHITVDMTQANLKYFYNDTNMATKDDILNCCLKIINKKHHVVLLSNNEDLLNNATSLRIHAYKFDTIKDSSNNINELNTNRHSLFLSNKIQSSRTQKMFQNIPGLMRETSVNIQTNQKSIFDDESVTTELTSEINRVIQGLNMKGDLPTLTSRDVFEIQKRVPNSNEVNSNKNIPFFLQNSKLLSFENRSNEPNKKFDILEKNKTEFQLKNIKIIDEEPVLKRSHGNMNTTSIPNTNINNDDTKNMTEMSVENNLRRFHIRDKVTENRIRKRIEEWMCIFTQSMEDALWYVLQNSSFKTDSIPPWTLQEMVERIKLLYEDHSTLKIVVKNLLHSMSECTSKGKIKADVKPHEFMRTLGCGVLLVQCLKSLHPDREELTNAKQSLTNLLRTIEDPTEIEFESTPKVSHNEIDSERRQNYVKQPSEIIKYLKEHYEDWKCYDELADQDSKKFTLTSINEDPKIYRISGKNLKLLKIDSNKSMTIIKCPNVTESKANNLGKTREADVSAGPNANENTEKLETVNKIINIPVKRFDVKKIPIISNHDKKIMVDDLNLSVNDNTFDTIKAGPKITRRISVIQEYEDKLKTNASLDMDLLDYSDIISDYSNNNILNNTQIVDNSKIIKCTNKYGKVDFEKKKFGYNNTQNTTFCESNMPKESMQSRLDVKDSGVNKNNSGESKFDHNDSGLKKSEYEMTNDHISVSDVTNPPKMDGRKSEIDSVMNKNDIIEKDYISISDCTPTKNDSTIRTEKDDSKVNTCDDLMDKDYIFVSDTTNDSGIGSDTHMTYGLVKTFLSELSSTFKMVHTFIDKNLNEFRQDQLADDKKTHLHKKVNEARRHLGDIINKLKSIVERESKENNHLNTLLTKLDEAANDKRITRYRSVIRKCLEQAQNLHSGLKIMLSITNSDWDGSLSIHAESISSSIRYLNIFE